MKYWLLITIYFVALSLNAQHDMLKNKHLSILDTVECNGELVTTAKFWEVYQTQNGQWDGAKDTLACYKVAVEGSNGFIVSNNFDLTNLRRYSSAI